MNLNKIKKTNYLNRLYLLLGIFLAIMLALIYLIIVPTISEIKETKKEVINQKNELEKKLNREKNLVTLNEDLKKIEPEVDSLNQIFIEKNMELEFITTLEGIAGKNNINQTLNLNTDKSIKFGQYTKTPIEISVQGKYNNLLDYLKNIETLKYYINISSLDLILENQDAASLYKTGRLQINADTYWK
jgi:Tfp pilus assembly protein PilO